MKLRGAAFSSNDTKFSQVESDPIAIHFSGIVQVKRGNIAMVAETVLPGVEVDKLEPFSHVLESFISNQAGGGSDWVSVGTDYMGDRSGEHNEDCSDWLRFTFDLHERQAQKLDESKLQPAWTSGILDLTSCPPTVASSSSSSSSANSGLPPGAFWDGETSLRPSFEDSSSSVLFPDRPQSTSLVGSVIKEDDKNEGGIDSYMMQRYGKTTDAYTRQQKQTSTPRKRKRVSPSSQKKKTNMRPSPKKRKVSQTKLAKKPSEILKSGSGDYDVPSINDYKQGRWHPDEMLILLNVAKQFHEKDLRTICSITAAAGVNRPRRAIDKQLKRMLKYNSWASRDTQGILTSINQFLAHPDFRELTESERRAIKDASMDISTSSDA